MIDAFEREFSDYLDISAAVALSSGTAALHLAMILLGVGPGDEVLCPSLTFIATANAPVYVGAQPVFLDSDRSTWDLDTNLLEEELEDCRRKGRMPKAVIAVDLYGQCADYEKIEALCQRYGVPLVEDAAEALGATCAGKKAGCFGSMAVFSFNGNKIITTSGGGMLVSGNEKMIQKARFLATQARDAAPHYQHSVIGYNYRMSNVLAAIGRAQLMSIEDRVLARRSHFEYYKNALENIPGISFMPEAPYGRSNRWLTCLTIEPEAFGATREDVRMDLESRGIESRPVWKPMHLQPVFSSCRRRGGAIAEELFERGLCLPSGNNLRKEDRKEIVDIILHACRTIR